MFSHFALFFTAKVLRSCRKELLKLAVEACGARIPQAHCLLLDVLILFARSENEKVTQCNTMLYSLYSNTGQLWSLIFMLHINAHLHSNVIMIAVYLADCQHASLIPFRLVPDAKSAASLWYAMRGAARMASFRTT